MLTEFRVEAISSSTNVALGALATATQPLHQTQSNLPVPTMMAASVLTDGWRSTLAHHLQKSSPPFKSPTTLARQCLHTLHDKSWASFIAAHSRNQKIVSRLANKKCSTY